MSKKIENLLKTANSSGAVDSSVNSAKRRFSNETQAKEFFDEVKLKLLNLEQWNAKSSASYELFDETSEICADKTLEIGKFIRISIPATGKDDWVKIIGIYEAKNEFVITVQPSYNPTEKPVDRNVTSHFYSREARNNFCLQRNETAVVCYVIGTDEKQNTDETKNLLETARNLGAANFGYYSGVQKGMWKSFCQNFLETEN